MRIDHKHILCDVGMWAERTYDCIGGFGGLVVSVLTLGSNPAETV
jgi:hypothetical protein